MVGTVLMLRRIEMKKLSGRVVLVACGASLGCAPIIEERRSAILSRESVVLEPQRDPVLSRGTVTASVLWNDVLVFVESHEICTEQLVEQRVITERVERRPHPWVLGFEVTGLAAATATAVGGLVVEGVSTPPQGDRIGPDPAIFVAFWGAMAMLPFGVVTIVEQFKYSDRTAKQVETASTGERRAPCPAMPGSETRPPSRRAFLRLRDGSARTAVVDRGGTARFEIDEATWDHFNGILDVDITVDDGATLHAVLRRPP